MFWADSFYNEKHEYKLTVSDYNDDLIGISEAPGNVDITVYKTNNEEAYRVLNEFGNAITNSVTYDGGKPPYFDYRFTPNYDVMEEVATFNAEVTKGKYDCKVETELPIDDQGIYFMEVKAFGKVLKNNFVLLNTYGIQSRSLPNEHYVTAQTFKTSEVMPNVKVDGYIFKEGQGIVKITEQITDTNGQIVFKDTPSEELDFVISEINGELSLSSQHYAIGLFNVDRIEVPEYFNYPADIKYHIITDREVYRPREIVKYKVIGRRNVADKWEILQENVIVESSY